MPFNTFVTTVLSGRSSPDACAFPLDRLVGDGRLRSPLHLAAEAGLHELVDSLLAGGRCTRTGIWNPLGHLLLKSTARIVMGGRR